MSSHNMQYCNNLGEYSPAIDLLPNVFTTKLQHEAAPGAANYHQLKQQL